MPARGRVRPLIVALVLSCSPACVSGQAQPAGGGRVPAAPCTLLHHQPPASADLIAAYRAQTQLFRSLHLTGSLRASTGAQAARHGRQRELAVVIDVLLPERLRIDGLVPYAGNRLWNLTSDGNSFGLLMPEGDRKVYLYGPVNASTSDNPWDLRPGPFLAALHWEEGSEHVEADPQPGTAADTLRVDVAASSHAAAHMLSVHFDAAGVADVLTIFDPAHSPAYEAHYSDWKTTTEPFSSQASGCYPRHILLLDKKHGLQLEINISDLELNLAVATSLFQPAAPRGIPARRLGPSGQ